jgi:hypothetical protein
VEGRGEGVEEGEMGGAHLIAAAAEIIIRRINKHALPSSSLKEL